MEYQMIFQYMVYGYNICLIRRSRSRSQCHRTKLKIEQRNIGCYSEVYYSLSLPDIKIQKIYNSDVKLGMKNENRWIQNSE